MTEPIRPGPSTSAPQIDPELTNLDATIQMGLAPEVAALWRSVMMPTSNLPSTTQSSEHGQAVSGPSQIPGLVKIEALTPGMREDSQERSQTSSVLPEPQSEQAQWPPVRQSDTYNNAGLSGHNGVTGAGASSMTSSVIPSQGGRPQEAINEARCLISDLVSRRSTLAKKRNVQYRLSNSHST